MRIKVNFVHENLFGKLYLFQYHIETVLAINSLIEWKPA